MTKNVTLLGASYPDVPSILLPQTGGGSAEFYADKGSWEGKNLEFVQDLGTVNWTLDDTSYSSWTPSEASATLIKERTDFTTFVADMANYDYVIKWFSKIVPAYVDGAELKAYEISQYTIATTFVFRYWSTRAAIYAGTKNANGSLSSLYYLLTHCYNANGADTISNNNESGIYSHATAITLSNSTSVTPTITVRTPRIYARASRGILSLTNAGKIDTTNTTITMEAKLYRMPSGDNMRVQETTEIINWYLSDNPPSRNIRQGEEEETEERDER